MKKRTVILLLAAALLCLAACSRGGSDQAAATPEPSATPTTDELALMAASDTDAVASRQSHVPPESPTDLLIDGPAYDKATGCVGKTIFDLYAAIGQPVQTPVYAPSATQQNAQEGTLIYTGFNVITLRTDTSEVVQRVDLTIDDASQPADQTGTDAAQMADQTMADAAQPADQVVGG